MKTIFLLAALATATVSTAFAVQPTITRLANDPVVALDEETLEFLSSRVRVSVGTERGTVIDQLGQPQAVLNRDIWVFTGFRASNVFGAEGYDSLLLVFKNDRVEKVTLTTEKTIRTAAAVQQAAVAKAGKVASN